MLKPFIAGAVGAPVLALAELVTAGAENIVLLGAAIATVGMLWQRIVRPFAQLIHRALNAYEILEQLPERISSIEDRLHSVEQLAHDADAGVHNLRKTLGLRAARAARAAR